MKTLAVAGLAALALAASAGVGLAQAPAAPPGPPPGFGPPARGPALALALEAAQTAIAACAANGYKVGAVVVDSAGAVRVMILNDGAPSAVGQIGTRKAFTAVTLKEPTAMVSEQVKTDTALADRIKNDPKMITWAGAQPLMAGADLIGALGVSGAPGGDKDDACTTVGVAKIKDRLK